MSAIERKLQVENLLKELDVFLHDDLPPLEEDSNVTLREPREIAKRIIILTYLNCSAEDDVLRKEIVHFLQTATCRLPTFFYSVSTLTYTRSVAAATKKIYWQRTRI